MFDAQALLDLGFVPDRPGFPGDFIARDDSDGRGVYIFEWKSETPCPFPEAIREPGEALPE